MSLPCEGCSCLTTAVVSDGDLAQAPNTSKIPEIRHKMLCLNIATRRDSKQKMVVTSPLVMDKTRKISDPVGFVRYGSRDGIGR